MNLIKKSKKKTILFQVTLCALLVQSGPGKPESSDNGVHVILLRETLKVVNGRESKNTCSLTISSTSPAKGQLSQRMQIGPLSDQNLDSSRSAFTISDGGEKKLQLLPSPNLFNLISKTFDDSIEMSYEPRPISDSNVKMRSYQSVLYSLQRSDREKSMLLSQIENDVYRINSQDNVPLFIEILDRHCHPL